MITIEIPKKEKSYVGNLIKRKKLNPESIIKQIGNEQLFLAIQQNNLEKVKILLEKGMDVNVAYGEYEITPLMYAVGEGHLEIVQFLLEKKADVNLFNELGSTALHSFCYKNGNTAQDLLIAEELIKHGANVNAACGCDGSDTPLMVAAQYGNLDMILLLIKFGADIYLMNGYNQTAYNCALISGHTKVAEKLLSFDLS